MSASIQGSAGPAPGTSLSRHSPEEICRRIVVCVARDFGLSAAALEDTARGSSRAAFARQVAMYLAHVGFALSFETIGRCFGRDRTTVAYACRLIEDGRDDIWFDCRIAALELGCRAASCGAAR